MIKVIHVISDVRIGGAGKWLLHLLRESDREGFLYKAVVPKESLLVKEIEQLGIEVIQIDGLADKSFDMGTVSVLRRIFTAEKADIVHTHASLSARIAARLAGVKAVVFTKHCIDPVKTGLKGKILALANRSLSDKIIGVSKAVNENLIQNGIPEKMIELVYTGVEGLREADAGEKARLRESWGIAPDELVAGMIARLTEVKSYPDFIEAAKLSLEKNDRLRFMIIGSGPKEQELKAQVRELGLEDKIIFTGFISDLSKIVNILDINVIASVSEALCLSLLDGMSLAKPCIGTNVGGVPEVILDGQNGILVPPRDPQSLAEAILRLAGDSVLRESMGQRGKEFMEKTFDAGAMADKIELIYKNLISNHQ